MTSASAPVLVLIADDDPVDPLLSVAFREANHCSAGVNALRYWPGSPTRALADRERWLFERLASYQEQYPDLYTTTEPVSDPSQITSKSKSARLTIVGERWLGRHHVWHREQLASQVGAFTVVAPYSPDQHLAPIPGVSAGPEQPGDPTARKRSLSWP